jgi:23S rRNA pseudouridine1911/1915/1917 synthase
MSEISGDILLLAIGEAQAGDRLDRAVASLVPGLSRSRVKALIEAGHLVQDASGATLNDPAFRVKPGQQLRLFLPAPEAALPLAQRLDLVIVHEDSDLIVIDKPAGLVVHPAPGSPDRTLVNALIAHCGESLSGIGGVRRPGIVHRIDKDTSGLIVAAKNDSAHRMLSEAFARHDIERAYQCLAWGCPIKKHGLIEGNIGRNPKDRKKMAVVKSGGRSPATEYRVTEFFGPEAVRPGAALIECRLRTGRTHQIRVHLAHIGHPLIGDKTYGRVTPARRALLAPAALAAATSFPRQALHAGVLGFVHPGTGKAMRWETKLPSDMTELLKALRG